MRGASRGESARRPAPLAREGIQNFGMVLLTEDAGIHGFSNNGCRTTYARNISLEVKSWN
jgi:hypothetical protein